MGKKPRERERERERERMEKFSRGSRVIMVVTYDRFVFFSVEKFFIPLLYSCLNILVQRKCERRWLRFSLHEIIIGACS